MNRKSVCSVLLCGIISIGFAENRKLPNIVFILADDMGYGDVSALNSRGRISTPNIDKLAQKGVVFTDAHSGSAVSTPTRYGLLTGRYCWRSKLKNGVLWDYASPLIPKDRTTMADMLKEKGYQTACIGKWHLGMDFPTIDGKEPVNKKELSNLDLRNLFVMVR